MANEHRQSLSSQTNCQVENKRCFFFFFFCSTRKPHNSLHPKVNIHTWQLRQRWRWGASATKHCIVGWARSCNWQWLREAPSLQTAYAADLRLRWDTKRGHNCIITFKQRGHFFSPPRNKANNQQVRRLENNACGPDTFVSGLLMNWKAALKRSFCITWGDLKCAVRAAAGSYCLVHLNENETQHRLPAATPPRTDGLFLHETAQMKIPCGTNCQVNAQLFDLQGAYKAMAKGIILYWLINAFSLRVQLAICQTGAHHSGYKYDLLFYCFALWTALALNPWWASCLK